MTERLRGFDRGTIHDEPVTVDCVRVLPSIDLGIAYREARLRVVSSVSGADDELIVPATPEWSVHDVMAHLSGVTEDVANGNMAGVTTDEWTAAQVTRGRSKPMEGLVAMWEKHSPMVESFLSSPEGASAQLAVIDIATHEADLRNALGLDVFIPDDVLAWAGNLMREGFLSTVATAGLPPVEVKVDDLEWFRGRLGRRTVEEVCSYDWSQDPNPYLDLWFIFGRARHSLGERVDRDW